MTNKQKQLQLKYLGYYLGKIDGSFGPQSKEATRKFQKDYGLVIDGYFGTLTQNKSILVWKDIQSMLIAKGFDCEKIDGYVGQKTINAIGEFQKHNNLKYDRCCGPLTLAKLKEKEYTWNDFKNFKRDEFKCPCGKCNGFPSEISLKLVSILQDIRNYYNKPLNITSGIRCQSFNDSLKGSVKNSPHIKGLAVDFYVSGVEKLELLSYCKKLKEQGIIKYTYTNNSNMGRAIHINL